MSDVLVVRTGTANLASVLAGFERVGAEPRLATRPEDVASAERVVLPGVGAFGAAMDELDATGMREALVARYADGAPTLSVCLGLQLLASASEETPGTSGLGVVQPTVRRFPDTVRVPQLGWNEIAPDEGCRLLAPGFVYFANSYCLREAPVGWDVAWAEHAGPFVAALEKGALLACQFHPELSGPFGLALLRRWLEA